MIKIKKKEAKLMKKDELKSDYEYIYNMIINDNNKAFIQAVRAPLLCISFYWR